MKEVSGRFSEEKLRKRLFVLDCRAFAPPREAEQKSFLLLFFKKEALSNL
jgi:hypothetical protein